MPPGSQILRSLNLTELPRIADPRGSLTFIEGGRQVPFEIKRIYYLYDIPHGKRRGGHAHLLLQQLIVAASGRLTVRLHDGRNQRDFVLEHPGVGLYIPPMMWRELLDFSPGAVCLVLASERHDDRDYIRDFGEFLAVSGASP